MQSEELWNNDFLRKLAICLKKSGFCCHFTTSFKQILVTLCMNPIMNIGFIHSEKTLYAFIKGYNNNYIIYIIKYRNYNP